MCVVELILVYSLLTLCYYTVVPEHCVMSESVFRDTWLKLLPYIITARPMSDLDQEGGQERPPPTTRTASPDRPPGEVVLHNDGGGGKEDLPH